MSRRAAAVAWAGEGGPGRTRGLTGCCGVSHRLRDLGPALPDAAQTRRGSLLAPSGGYSQRPPPGAFRGDPSVEPLAGRPSCPPGSLRPWILLFSPSLFPREPRELCRRASVGLPRRTPQGGWTPIRGRGVTGRGCVCVSGRGSSHLTSRNALASGMWNAQGRANSNCSLCPSKLSSARHQEQRGVLREASSAAAAS